MNYAIISHCLRMNFSLAKIGTCEQILNCFSLSSASTSSSYYFNCEVIL
jgi:hypothetical protein